MILNPKISSLTQPRIVLIILILDWRRKKAFYLLKSLVKQTTRTFIGHIHLNLDS